MLSMKTLTLALVASIGLTACAVPVSDEGRCATDVRLAKAARTALLDYSDDVPDAVGEAATTLIVAVLAGCGR